MAGESRMKKIMMTQDGLHEMTINPRNPHEGWACVSGGPVWYSATQSGVWMRTEPSASAYLGRWREIQAITLDGVVRIQVSPLGDLGISWDCRDGALIPRGFKPNPAGVWVDSAVPDQTIHPVEVM